MFVVALLMTAAAVTCVVLDKRRKKPIGGDGGDDNDGGDDFAPDGMTDTAVMGGTVVAADTIGGSAKKRGRGVKKEKPSDGGEEGDGDQRL